MTAPDELDRERADFEAWASRNGWAESDLGDKCAAGSPRADEYRHHGLQSEWEVWAAAVAAERERWTEVVMAELDGNGQAQAIVAYATRA